MQNTSTHWLVQVSIGAFLFVLSLAANGVDLFNNLHYGLQTSTQAGVILAVFALGVVGIPAAAGVIGWRKYQLLFVGATMLCVGVTAWSSYKQYAQKGDSAILSTKGAQDTYERAQERKDAAKATLKRITEDGTVEELSKALNLAEADRADVCENRSRQACDIRKDIEKTATRKLSDAKARDAAKAELIAVEPILKAGPAKFSGDNIDAERSQSQVWDILIIIGTQLMALIGGPAVETVAAAFRARPQRQRKPEAKAQTAAPAKRKRKPSKRDEVLARYREMHGVSQNQAADLLKVNRTTFKRWLKDAAEQEAAPSDPKVIKLRS